MNPNKYAPVDPIFDMEDEDLEKIAPSSDDEINQDDDADPMNESDEEEPDLNDFFDHCEEESGEPWTLPRRADFCSQYLKSLNSFL